MTVRRFALLLTACVVIPLLAIGGLSYAVARHRGPHSAWEDQTACLPEETLDERFSATTEAMGLTDVEDIGFTSSWEGDTDMYAFCAIDATVNGNDLYMTAIRYAGHHMDFEDVPPGGGRDSLGRVAAWQDDTWRVDVLLSRERGAGPMLSYAQLVELAHADIWFGQPSPSQSP